MTSLNESHGDFATGMLLRLAVRLNGMHDMTFAEVGESGNGCEALIDYWFDQSRGELIDAAKACLQLHERMHPGELCVTEKGAAYFLQWCEETQAAHDEMETTDTLPIEWDKK